jgi:O-antigen ligase
LAFVFGERFIYGFIIVSLFTLVGDVSGSFRIYIQLTAFILLGILFLRKFGFEWAIYPRVPNSIIYFLFLYYIAMITSTLMSRFPSAAVPFIVQQSIFFIVLYLLYSLIRDDKDVAIFLISILISSIILTASSIAAFVEGGLVLSNVSVGRISGLIANVNVLTNFYIISFPLVIVSFFIKLKYLDKKLSLLLIIFLLAGLLITISRTAVLGVVISAAFLFFMLEKKYFYYLLTVTIVLLAFLFLYQSLNEFVTLLLRIEEGMSNRDYLWTLSLNIINDHPVFGIGAGSYKYEMFNYFPVMFSSWSGQTIINLWEKTSGANISHNFFLRSYTDLGILGLISALLIPVIYFRIGLKTVQYYRKGNKKTYYVLLALFISGATMFLRSAVDDIGILTYGWIAADLPFWLIFSCIVFYYKNIGSSKTI